MTATPSVPGAGSDPPATSTDPAVATTTIWSMLHALRRRWAILAACCALGGLAAFAHTELATPQYSSTATVLLTFNGGQTPNELVQGDAYSQQLVQAYSRIAVMPVILDPVIQRLGLDTTSRRLASSVSVKAPVESVLMDITVTRSAPVEAARIADAISTQLATAIPTITPPGRPGTGVEVTTVAPALPAAGPSSPRPRMELAIGVVVGGLLGMVAAAVAEALRSPLPDRRALTRATGSPVMSVLPRTRHRQAWITQSTGGDELEEALRALRDALTVGPLAPVQKTTAGGLRLVITSATAGEGAAITAAGLARVMAESGERVLLIDADLHTPVLDNMLHLDPAVGLSTVLEGAQSWAVWVQPWGGHQVDVLTTGPTGLTTGRLLSTGALGRLLEEVTGRYDVVLLRTAPVLDYADAAAVTRLVDGAVVVVNADHNSSRQIDEMMARMETAGARIVGLVLDRARDGRRRSSVGRRPQPTRPVPSGVQRRMPHPARDPYGTA